MDSQQEHKTSLVPVSTYAAQVNLTADEVIQKIREGKLAGEWKDGAWFVDRELSQRIATGYTGSISVDAERTIDVKLDVSTIRGLLLLPALGLIFSLIANIVGFITIIRALPSADYLGVGPSFILLAVLGFLFVVYQIYAATQLFKRKRKAPKVMIGMYIFNGLYALVGVLVFSNPIFRGIGTDVISGMVSSILAALIWIPYFSISKRVKGTFVE